MSRTHQRPHRTFKAPLRQQPYATGMLYQNVAGYRQPQKHTKPKRLISLRTRAYLVMAVMLFVGGYAAWNNHVSAEALAAHQAQLQAAAEAQRKADAFGDQVQALLTGQTDMLSIAVASDTQSVKTYGSTDTFDGASTAKLLTAADYLHHVEQGSASLTQKIDGRSAQSWLRAMIVQSDDTAWAALNGYLTHDDLVTYGNSIGFTNYDPEVNTFTASDVARLMQQLYTGKLLNTSHRALLLNYLSSANYRQYIVAAVPSTDTVYHKVGWDGDTINDAAIITKGQKYAVLVIFSNGNGSYDTAARTQLIHTITNDAVAAYL